MATHFDLPLDSFVRQQTELLRELWYACDDDMDCLPGPICVARKIKNEETLSQLLDWVGSNLDLPRGSERERKEFSSEAVRRLKNAGKTIFDLDDEQVNCLESLGIAQSAESFFQKAREFDPFISFEDIFQASRNVWTSNYLQVLMGLPVELTPSLFAYSMLYPVSDNYLDDPSRSRADKVAYNQRFRTWLEGRTADPQNCNESDVLDLVRMVEKQYPRSQFSQVYESMLAIHSAQDKSMRIPKAPLVANTVDIVSLTIEKGGTSVLADGVLAAGELSREQMEIIFNYGAFAQLMDDQEDIASDLKEGAATLFTEAARAGKADQIMNRVFHFAHEVLQGLDKFDNPKAIPLKKMSMKGIDLLLIDAVLRMEKYYSNAYLQELEKYFPFRFNYLKQVRKTIEKRKITAERLTGLIMVEAQPANLTMIDPIRLFFSERRLISVR